MQGQLPQPLLRPPRLPSPRVLEPPLDPTGGPDSVAGPNKSAEQGPAEGQRSEPDPAQERYWEHCAAAVSPVADCRT